MSLTFKFFGFTIPKLLPVWPPGSNNNFHILNNITHIFTLFYPYIFQRTPNNNFQTTLSNTSKCYGHSPSAVGGPFLFWWIWVIWQPRQRLYIYIYIYIYLGSLEGQNGPLALIFEIFSNRALFRK